MNETIDTIQSISQYSLDMSSQCYLERPATYFDSQITFLEPPANYQDPESYYLKYSKPKLIWKEASRCQEYQVSYKSYQKSRSLELTKPVEATSDKSQVFKAPEATKEANKSKKKKIEIPLTQIAGPKVPSSSSSPLPNFSDEEEDKIETLSAIPNVSVVDEASDKSLNIFSSSPLPSLSDNKAELCSFPSSSLSDFSTLSTLSEIEGIYNAFADDFVNNFYDSVRSTSCSSYDFQCVIIREKIPKDNAVNNSTTSLNEDVVRV